MIKHHPQSELLNSYVSAELPVALNVAVAAHVEMCPCCQRKIEHIEQNQAELAFSTATANTDVESTQLDDMLNSILISDEIDEALPTERKTVNKLGGEVIQLPSSLGHMQLNPWFKLGKVARATIDTDERDIHCHLLTIEAGGKIPHHTHKGYEVTLILEGSFEDEMGTYSAGDFIWLDGQHTHNPVTREGCTCLTVANDALYFTQGLTKLLNPIGKLLY